MDIDVKNINKNYKKTSRTIYKSIDEPYSGVVTIFPKSFIEHCKSIQMSHITSHLKSIRRLKLSL